MLRRFVSPDQQDWDIHLPLLMFAYRSSPHAATSYTPQQLMFGRTPASWVTRFRGTRQRPTNGRYDAYLMELEVTMSRAYDLADTAARELAARPDARRSRSHDFQRGQRVWLFNSGAKSMDGLSVKFLDKWMGPFNLGRLITPVTFEILSPDGKAHSAAHVDRLLHYVSPAKPPPPTQPPIVQPTRPTVAVTLDTVGMFVGSTFIARDHVASVLCSWYPTMTVVVAAVMSDSQYTLVRQWLSQEGLPLEVVSAEDTTVLDTIIQQRHPAVIVTRTVSLAAAAQVQTPRPTVIVVATQHGAFTRIAATYVLSWSAVAMAVAALYPVNVPLPVVGGTPVAEDPPLVPAAPVSPVVPQPPPSDALAVSLSRPACLPADWTMLAVPRRNDPTKIDKYFIAPDGTKLRSVLELKKHLNLFPFAPP